MAAPNLDLAKELAAAEKALAPAAKRIAKALANFDPTKLPVGSLVDFNYQLGQLTKQLNKLTTPFTDVIPGAQKAVEEHFIATLAVGESSGVQGKTARVQITERVIPIIENSEEGWKKFYAHIKRTGEFELLNRAPNARAIQERWDTKKNVPGVGRLIQKRVSCTKLGGK